MTPRTLTALAVITGLMSASALAAPRKNTASARERAETRSLNQQALASANGNGTMGMAPGSAAGQMPGNMAPGMAPGMAPPASGTPEMPAPQTTMPQTTMPQTDMPESSTMPPKR